MSLFLVVFFSFLAVATLIVMVVLLVMAVQSSPKARIRERLKAIGRSPYASRAEIQSLLKRPVYSEIPWLNDLLNELNFVHGVTILLERANMDIKAGFFLLFSAFFAAITVSLLTLLSQGSFITVVFGLIAFAGPYLYVRFLAWKRLRKFLER